MLLRLICVCVIIGACTGRQEKKIVQNVSPAVSIQLNSSNDQEAKADTRLNDEPVFKPMKSPSGIYRFILPFSGNKKIEHTIQFSGNEFLLQEKYIGSSKDSIVLSEGTWSPSDGFIWLYKDQLVGGRYRWKGETLQYFSPRLNKLFPMHKLISAYESPSIAEKKTKGVLFYGVGTEPFWNVETSSTGSISFSTPDFKEPVRARISHIVSSGDTTTYFASRDSIDMKVVAFAYFCNNGMSDFIYPDKILVHYNGKQYSGCGIVFKKD
jgi:uncharacterized membrane protein